MRLWKRSTKGFTLIELVVVIVIIGILAAVAVPKFFDMGANTRKAVCKANRGTVASACGMYYASSATTTGGTPSYPASLTTALFADGVPTCPAGGVYTYDATKGKVTCDFAGHTD